jgi:hypothetical protein
MVTGFGVLFRPFPSIFLAAAGIHRFHFLCCQCLLSVLKCESTTENVIEMCVDDEKIAYVLEQALEEPTTI